MDIREILASNLRLARRAKGLSQEELAYRAEIDRTYVSALERSRYAVSIDVLARLARVLDVEAADLLRRQSAPAKKFGLGAGTSNRKQLRQPPQRKD
ncbi:helix-turn-helix transcriptional regulator [Belnapia sp. T18]|uniref:Helix-turn-helix transcriptional regulator n=1 Tax=Belnapia arida TaxID=2804533 RepID=A0ABS1UDH7_9PROT|nr:helix-turn-helix transcriptional regulator [Belnapia arida]MBL6082752.1 helix-turn-helix transcriptional regulator [Belnapia arida]